MAPGQEAMMWRRGSVVRILIGAAMTTVIVSVKWFRVTLLLPVVNCWRCTGNHFVPATDKLVGSDQAIGSWIPVNLKASRPSVIVLLYVRHLLTKPEITKSCFYYHQHYYFQSLANSSFSWKIISFLSFVYLVYASSEAWTWTLSWMGPRDSRDLQNKVHFHDQSESVFFSLLEMIGQQHLVTKDSLFPIQDV